MEGDITELLHFVHEKSASDLFLSEGKKAAFRLDGEIRKLDQTVEKEHFQQFLSKVLSAKQQGIFQEDGDLDFGYTTSQDLRFRINLARQQGGFSLIARPLVEGNFQFADLGLPDFLKGLTNFKSGIILVTGATGSGKSTSLAAMIHHINLNRAVHIVTIEDPIEFIHRDHKSKVMQREVGTDTSSFHEGLRRVVRQSPDVILIGEMRDKQSIQVALSAALTGHLVLATLHTIDAAQTLQRLMSYFPEYAQGQVAIDLALSLRGIISQRLLPKVGDVGRILACEILTNTPAVSYLLRERNYSQLEDLLRTSTTEDLQSFNRYLLGLVDQDLVSREVALAYSSNRDELQLMLQGMSNTAQGIISTTEEQEQIPDIRQLLQLTMAQEASDLHLTTGRMPLMRKNGTLVPLIDHRLTSADMRMLLNSVMNGRQRSLYELEKEVDFSLGLPTGQRFRVNAYFQRGNMAAALRAIPSYIPRPAAMNIPQEIMKFCNKPHGLILVVGPTGSGKSTTLACMIDQINKTRCCRIITVEDPIEFTHKSLKSTIDQREVYSDTKSFANALKYILRQDPDVILVGEMRDYETVAAALTAAETGHLVFATLHTNDAVQTIDRIIDVFPAHQQEQVRSQLAASLQVVISQRLLVSISGEGRVPAFEIMIGTKAIQALIRDNKMHQAQGMMEASKSLGMITMDRSLQDLAAQGLISLNEAERYMKSPKTQQASPYRRY